MIFQAEISMQKKNEFIRIRVDEELKTALKEAAAREDRQESDQARYILRRGLGLVPSIDNSGISRKKGPSTFPRRLG